MASARVVSSTCHVGASPSLESLCRFLDPRRITRTELRSHMRHAGPPRTGQRPVCPDPLYGGPPYSLRFCRLIALINCGVVAVARECAKGFAPPAATTSQPLHCDVPNAADQFHRPMNCRREATPLGRTVFLPPLAGEASHAFDLHETHRLGCIVSLGFNGLWRMPNVFGSHFIRA